MISAKFFSLMLLRVLIQKGLGKLTWLSKTRASLPGSPFSRRFSHTASGSHGFALKISSSQRCHGFWLRSVAQVVPFVFGITLRPIGLRLRRIVASTGTLPFLRRAPATAELSRATNTDL